MEVHIRTVQCIRVNHENQNMKISNSPVGLWFMGTNIEKKMHVFRPYLLNFPDFFQKKKWKSYLNHFQQLFPTFPIYEFHFFSFCTDAPYFVWQRAGYQLEQVLIIFAFSTSICTHKPRSDRWIWNFHVLAPMVHPNVHAWAYNYDTVRFIKPYLNTVYRCTGSR